MLESGGEGTAVRNPSSATAADEAQASCLELVLDFGVGESLLFPSGSPAPLE